MVERVAQHRHCHYCDKAIPVDKQYCDDNCETQHKTILKTKKRQLLIFYVIMIIIFVFAVFLSIGGI